MMKVVIDSNCLQSDRLDSYLRRDRSNKVVLITAATVEAYKNNYERGLPKSFEILGRYACQVLVAKDNQSVVSINGRSSGLQGRLISKSDTKKFSKFVNSLRSLPNSKELDFVNEVRLQKSREVERYLKKLKDESENLKKVISIRAARYSKKHISGYRKGLAPSKEFIDLIRKEVEVVAGNASGVLEIEHNLPCPAAPIPNGFIFRLALANHLLVIDWIANGGANDVNPDKLLNDVMDMHFVVYATYFDGLMTNDRKQKSLYKELRWWLENVYGCRL